MTDLYQSQRAMRALRRAASSIPIGGCPLSAPMSIIFFDRRI